MERSWQCHGLFRRFFHGFFHRTGVVFTANSHPAPNMDGTSLKRVAEETIDPELSNIDHDQCPDGWNCRYSDAAFAELDSDKSLDLAGVAKPKGVVEPDVDPAGR